MSAERSEPAQAPLAYPVSTRPQILRRRADFLRAARAARAPMPAFLLQARARGDDAPLRVGFTCSKKVGNAVARNRAKRRLRALAAEILPQAGRPGWDYVLIGRAGATASRPFAQMRRDLLAALERVHAPGPARPPRPPRPPRAEPKA